MVTVMAGEPKVVSNGPLSKDAYYLSAAKNLRQIRYPEENLFNAMVHRRKNKKLLRQATEEMIRESLKYEDKEEKGMRIKDNVKLIQKYTDISKTDIKEVEELVQSKAKYMNIKAGTNEIRKTLSSVIFFSSVSLIDVAAWISIGLLSFSFWETVEYCAIYMLISDAIKGIYQEGMKRLENKYENKANYEILAGRIMEIFENIHEKKFSKKNLDETLMEFENLKTKIINQYKIRMPSF